VEKVIIRPAQINDVESIYSKICELENNKMDKSTFAGIFKENLKKDNIFYIVAEFQGQPIGFISLHIQKLLHHNGNAAEIQELFVDSDMRGKKIGSKLINYAKDISEKHQCKSFEVSCNLKRAQAHKFYEKEGLSKTHYKLTKISD
jgi:(aminoalkyl)phosphonate N-acetyltransferase